MHSPGPSHPALEPALEALDLDDLDTTIEATPYPRLLAAPEEEEEPLPDTLRGAPAPPARHSYIRLRPPPTPDDIARQIEALHDDHINLMVDIVCLEHSLAEAATLAPLEVARQVVPPLRRRVADLVDVRAAVSDLLADKLPRMLVAPNAALGVYLRGLFVWCANAIAALDDYARDAGVATTNAGELRVRLRLAAETHFEAVMDDVRADVIALKIVYADQRESLDGFLARVDELFWTTWWLQRSLESLV